MSLTIEFGNALDPFRVFAGADPGDNPVAAGLLFSTRYPRVEWTEYQVALPSGSGSGAVPYGVTYPQAPLVAGVVVPTVPGAPYGAGLVRTIVSGVTTSPSNWFFYQAREDQLLWEAYGLFAGVIKFWVLKP